VNVSKIANNINTVGDDSTAARCNSRLITVFVQHANDIVSVTKISCFRDNSIVSVVKESFHSWGFPMTRTHFTGRLLYGQHITGHLTGRLITGVTINRTDSYLGATSPGESQLASAVDTF